MPTPKQIKQRKYIDMLIDKALAIALENPESLNFDPQGRVLIEVDFLEDRVKDEALASKYPHLDGEELATQIDLDRKENHVQAKEQYDELKNFFGGRLTPVTTVSLDINSEKEDRRFEPLKKAYQEQYALDSNHIDSIDATKSRSSIIPLQQEFYFHLQLAARTYTAMFPGKFPEEQMNLAHKAAMIRLQPLIVTTYQAALAKATKARNATNTVDESILLNRELDKARKKLSTKAHHFLFEEVVKVTGEKITKNDLRKAKVKHVAEATTATANDLLHTDYALKQSVWISGSDKTSHERVKGHLADRQVMTFAFKPEHQGKPRIQIRSPSLDVKENLSERDAVADIQEKLGKIKAKYDLHHEINGNPDLNIKAITYNLHTALNDRLEGGKNKQSQGANYILQGAHAYNANQLQIKPPESQVLCFVQNISVNGFGDSLGYGKNELATEATLMAEMAMLYNLTDKKDAQFKNIDSVFAKYKTYLADKNRPPFFSQSQAGKEAIELLTGIKSAWASDPAAVKEDNDAVANAKAALKQMMANNLHHQHEFSKLFQSLSIYIEEASLSGCKSGNERAQAINGRVSILDSVAHNKKDPIMQAISILAQSDSKDLDKNARLLKNTLDAKYDLNLQSGVSLISDVDQGAAAKVNAKITYAQAREKGLGVFAALKVSIVSSFNRNYAEEYLPHLQQDKAGKMQAHKGLTTQMIAFWPSESKNFFPYMKSKLGTFGAILSFPLFPIAIVGAIFYRKYEKGIEADNAKLDKLAAEAIASKKEIDEKRIEKVTASYDVNASMLPSDHIPIQKDNLLLEDLTQYKPHLEGFREEDLYDIPEKDIPEGQLFQGFIPEVPVPVIDPPVSEKLPEKAQLWENVDGTWRKNTASPVPVAPIPTTTESIKEHMSELKDSLNEIKKKGHVKEYEEKKNTIKESSTYHP